MTFLSQFNFGQFYQLNLNPVILGELKEKILFFPFVQIQTFNGKSYGTPPIRNSRSHMCLLCSTVEYNSGRSEGNLCQ